MSDAIARFRRLREGWRAITGGDGSIKSESQANFAAGLALAIEVAEAQCIDTHDLLLARQKLRSIAANYVPQKGKNR